MNPEESHWHEGAGLPFFRCMTCTRPVSPKDIKGGGCAHCGGSRIRPTDLTFLEKCGEVIRNPRILLLLFK